jgi:hypothetical protein
MKIATKEMVKKYWLDKCPVCGGTCISACRCPRNERWCPLDHHWRRLDDGSAVMCGKNHTDIGNE